MYHESPGSIVYQVGLSLSVIRECVEDEDDFGAANQFRYLVSLTSPHTTPEERLKMRVARDKDDDPEVVFAQVFEALEMLLPILARHKIYAFIAGDVGKWEDAEEAGEEGEDEGAVSDGGP